MYYTCHLPVYYLLNVAEYTVAFLTRSCSYILYYCEILIHVRVPDSLTCTYTVHAI